MAPWTTYQYSDHQLNTGLLFRCSVPWYRASEISIANHLNKQINIAIQIPTVYGQKCLVFKWLASYMSLQLVI